MSPLGRVAFDDKGDPKYFSAVLFQTQKGTQVVVYPTDRSAGSVQYPGVPWGREIGGSRENGEGGRGGEA